jgi:tetratricopeptide (TPR) repeat protein
MKVIAVRARHAVPIVAFILLVGLCLLSSGAKGQAEEEHYLKGMVLFNKGSYAEAILELEAEVKDHPDNLSAWYNLALSYEKAGDEFRAYYQWKKYLELDSTSRWAGEARRHLLELERKVRFGHLEVEEAKITDVFPSIYKYYSVHPVGYLVLGNRSKDTTFYDIKTSLSVKRYMDYPTEGRMVKVLSPGERVKIDLYAGFNNHVLEVTEDTPVQALIELRYVEGDKVAGRSQTVSFTMHNRNAMTWDVQEKLASFVTAKDPAVRTFARNIVQMKDEGMTHIPEAVYKAMLVFNALGVYGMVYIEDPATPYRKMSETTNILDYIQYPVDTLRLKAGDCDDGVVLYAALLESIGIPTALVDFPGHVFSMFDTGLTLEEADMVSPDEEMYIYHDGHIWVPVETTLWGRPFTEAWRRAMDRYKSAADVKVVVIGEAWDLYSPVTLMDTGWIPEVPARERIDPIMSQDGRMQSDMKVSFIRSQGLDDVADPKALNESGVVYARSMLYDEAVEKFERALEVDPDYMDARVNLAYAYYQIKKYDESISEFLRAIQLEPGNARLHFDLGLVYQESQDYKKAEEEFQVALKLDPSYRSQYSSVKDTRSRSSEGRMRIGAGWRR